MNLRVLMEIFIVSLRLGLTSFGGPVAHLGYFRHEYVERRKWLSEKNYADLVALCQFLPGPASSQVGIGIGMSRGGIAGGFVSFLGFTMPSVLILIAAAVGFQQQGWTDTGIIDGLKIVAVAVVAHAVLGMGKNLAPDKERATIAASAFILLLVLPSTWMQVIVILIGAAAGFLLYRHESVEQAESLPIRLSRTVSIISLSLFAVLLAGLPVLRALVDHVYIQILDGFYRAGALVFGGGHVVLPLLEREVVPNGLVSEEAFLAGYGAAQAVPGPLFTFASYLGMAAEGIPGAVIATAAIFLPAFLLLIGALPFWLKLREYAPARAALYGVNAAVVGILLTALYAPIFTTAVETPVDLAFAALLFVLLVYWKKPAWMIVILGIAGGLLFGLL
ncbi:chromate efflux transporter [Alkalicoccus urumqiensis]|uniref:ChrA protein n=1 Tax=Alkalicoccus urumqiensis TaxID=1548213 RepID=A0A2P6MEJ3_ALKUR|nr:chromate efflux transporter [Alkalicoccus urumqiensis]PRO64667.1 ChrA protein [Alkalicoccus urumqiensis]